MVLVACFVSSAAASTKPRNPHCGRSAAPVLCAIHRNYRVANWWRARMSLKPYGYSFQGEMYPKRRPSLLLFWRGRRVAAKRQYELWSNAPWLHGAVHDALLCIHHYEGSWTDPNAPYWGGLQMDQSFMQSYNPAAFARWGTADHWPVGEQLEAGWRAVVSGRGFGPWPATRLMCGV